MARQNKRLKIGLLALTGIALAGLTIWGAIYVANHQGRKTTSRAVSCGSGVYATHKVVVQNGAVSPAHTTAARCDQLTITNLDDTTRLMAFGRHDEHVPYDGIEERLLAHDQSVTVTLIDTGKFKFHDHLHDEVQGTFTVDK